MSKFSEHPLAGKYDIDSAFTGAWSFYKKWFLPMYAISFILALIVSALTSKVDISSLQYASEMSEITAQLRSLFGVYAITALVSLLFNTLLQYYIIFRPVNADFNLSDALIKVITKYYFPLLIIFIILGIFAAVAMTVGTLLLFIGLLFAIPYVMLFIAMTTPILMIENRGIDGTLKRLFKLVHKRFWPNMAWISVYLILIIFFSFIIGTLVMLPFSGSMLKSLMDPEAGARLLEIASNPAYIILSSLATALTAPIMPILGLVLYFNNSGAEANSSGTSNKDNEKVKVEDLYSTNNKDDYSPTVDDLTP